ncbi:ribosomal protein L36e [Kipferlia bialata]|uniref:Ribosomal protein L36e n=1 Tax=Kipferlia bialata TaxID=797122 RepID=A0A391NXS5_9EUKA|nr:ribosomal protein L36e [Kipferlia bialata]|eukprot:g8892.t1
MALSKTPTGVAIGKNHGHATVAHARVLKQSEKKSSGSKHVMLVRAVIQEVTGLNPYEKHIIELLRLGKDRQALRFVNRRLGNIKRAKGKVAQMQQVIRN